jgi:hypothetical protein
LAAPGTAERIAVQADKREKGDLSVSGLVTQPPGTTTPEVGRTLSTCIFLPIPSDSRAPKRQHDNHKCTEMGGIINSLQRKSIKFLRLSIGLTDAGLTHLAFTTAFS